MAHSLFDRQRACLLGLAVGDALGAAVEFKPLSTFPPVTGYRDGGPHGLAPGEWTDDTSMALALADSLASVGWDLTDQADRYVAWWRDGKYSVNGTCFDIGVTTRDALSRFQRGVSARESGSPDESASGNGSIMRLAPVPIRYHQLFPSGIQQLAAYAEQSSSPTHRSPQCLSACRYFALVLAALMAGQPREAVLSPTWPLLTELERHHALHPAIREVALGSFRGKHPPAIRGSGYVVHSLEAALWAFHRAPTFRDAVLAAVNLGDDADTTGAICGQLAGAYFGVQGIPSEWLQGLVKREWIEDAVKRLTSGLEQPHRELAGDTHSAPTDRCYWVVPSLLLAGAYPGHAQPAKHEARLQKLWSAGIRTFVSLMEPHETNNVGEAFTAYDATIAKLATAAGEAAAFMRFPIRDVCVPSKPTMLAVLDTIDQQLAARRPVYVHCFGGIGRTGTVVGCWLIRHGHATAANVQEVLAKLRLKDADRAACTSPETQEQRAFVSAWKG